VQASPEVRVDPRRTRDDSAAGLGREGAWEGCRRPRRDGAGEVVALGRDVTGLGTRGAWQGCGLQLAGVV
jgi:hypothetical protein